MQLCFHYRQNDGLRILQEAQLAASQLQRSAHALDPYEHHKRRCFDAIDQRSMRLAPYTLLADERQVQGDDW
jgi:hypothetical protein